MIAAILKRGWPGPFTRVVRDPAGKEVRRLVFKHGEPQMLGAEDAKAVANDIGKALIPVDANGKPLMDAAPEPAPAEPEQKPRSRRNGMR